MLDRALRTADAKRTVTAIIVPADVQELEYEEPEHAFKMVPSGLGLPHPAAVPAQEEIGRAAEVLNRGQKVAILVGQGARHARPQVEQSAEVGGSWHTEPLPGLAAVFGGVAVVGYTP